MPQTSAVQATIADFDYLAKGDPAPDWLRDGILERWGLPQDSTAITLITVSENATFVIMENGSPTAVIRVSRPGYVPSAKHIESELMWVRALSADIDTPVPSAIPATDGSYVQTISDERGVGWYVVAFRFVTGTILEDDFVDPLPYYERIGAITAGFHTHSQSWKVPSDFERFSWELPDMLGSKARWGNWRAAKLTVDEIALLERAEDAAVSALSTAEKSPLTWGIIHADLRPSNIMVNDGALTVIDFDDCGYAWYLYDFASAFSFVEHLDVTPSLAQSWLAGYSSIIPLTQDQITHATALSMVRRLQMLGWTTTHREDALPADIWQAQVPGTVEVAQRYLADPLWLLHR